MQTTTRVVMLCAGASVALFAVGAPAAAAPKRITGKLSEPGYTVIALAENGKARSDRVKRGPFSVKSPAKRVTLQLRGADGVYAGPIVVARKRGGKRAIEGVRAGAKLGAVKVSSRRGYAKVKRRLKTRWVDKARVARAKKGVPIGAGVFGRVRSKGARGGAPGDRDLDGVPDRLDIDDDGDLVLDNLDFKRRSKRARAAQAGDPKFHVRSVLGVTIDQTANANAAGLTDEQSDAALRTGVLNLPIIPGDDSELDCGGSPDPANPDAWTRGPGRAADRELARTGPRSPTAPTPTTTSR